MICPWNVFEFCLSEVVRTMNSPLPQTPDNALASHFPLNVCIRDAPTHRPAMPEGELAKPGQASDVQTLDTIIKRINHMRETNWI